MQGGRSKPNQAVEDMSHLAILDDDVCVIQNKEDGLCDIFADRVEELVEDSAPGKDALCAVPGFEIWDGQIGCLRQGFTGGME